MSSAASSSKAKDTTKSENVGSAAFSSSNSNNRSQPKVIYSSHNSARNQKPIPIIPSRNRSKSSSLSEKRAPQFSSVEIGSYPRTSPAKTSASTFNNSDFSRTSFAPAMKNFQNPRRRSLSSNSFEGSEPTPIKNSMVITNSRMAPDISNDQTLSSITFNDKICFALPPKLTLDELRGCSAYDVSYLLDITRDMNLQLKKKKKRSKKPRDPFAPRQTNASTSTSRPLVRTEPNRNSVPREVKNNTPQVKLTPTESQQTKQQTSQSTSNAQKVSKPLKQISPIDLLKIRSNGVPDNPEIIKVVEELKIYANKPPDCELINEEKLFRFPKKLQAGSYEPPLMKQLMQRSWRDLEENSEERTSRAIYENLKHIVQNFDDNDQDGKSVTEEKSKKKKAKKKANENTEVKNKTQTDIEDPANLIFEEYYDREKVDKGLQDGSLFKDNIRINSKNYKEAYIFCPYDGRDIFIDGIRDRNRALEGDEVVVELHAEDKWKVHNDESVQKSGKIVFILQENHPRTAVGYLKLMFKKNKIDKFLLCPRDSRVPRIKISPNLCPSYIKNDFKRFEDYLFEGKILKWEAVSFAEGILLRELGKHNDVETETQCILLENHLNVEPYEDVDGYLASTEETIPENEIQKRVDIRNQCVLTIDPVGAKDLDDALSCVELPNGHFEVGVHIADVSHYVLPDTPLDENAREKATSVYLTQKVFHMLPNKLCNLCSLLPGTDKLAFSLFVELDQNAEIVNHRFSKTVIRSCSQFTYQHAQAIMEKDTSEPKAADFPPIENGFTLDDVVKAILNLQSLARKIRKRRFDGGALRIDQPKILFSLDENYLPKSFSLFVPKESNWLIEEFMLLANILTANRLREKYPDLALLRNHSPPNEKSLSLVVENLEKIGIYIDNANAGSIYHSMMRYDGFDEIGIARMAVIINLLIKPMVKACYTCSTSDSEGDNDFWHYALNVPFYTHFTSPIRRYADIAVHRLLASSLGYCELPKWTPDDIQSIAENCNKKKNSAKKASEVCSELFLKLYMEKHGPVKVRAVVIEVKERLFDLIDLSTRSNHRVYTERIKIAQVKFENDNGMPSLKLTWKGEGETETIEQLIQIFTIIDVQLAYNKSVNKVTVSLLRPSS